MENISTILNDNQSSASATNKSITAHAANLMTTTTPSKQFNTSNSSSNLTSSNHSNTTTATTTTQVVQVKNAIREIGHVWSTALHEHAMKIHVLQRVMMKKEDPTTHIKFIHVLKQYSSSSTNIISSNQASPKGNITTSDHSNATTISTQLLISGKLLDLFWYRLSVSLSDIAADKVKHYTIASCQSYPYLRKAAVNTVTTLEHWIEIDAQRDNAGNIFHTNTIENNSFQLYSSPIASNTYTNNVSGISSITASTDSGISLYGNTTVSSHGMFGSLHWNQSNLLDYQQQHSLVESANKFHMKQQQKHPNYQLKILSTTIPNKSTHSIKNNHQNILSSVSIQSNNPIVDINELEDDLSPSSTTSIALEDHYLVQGLKPFRDRYLIISLSKMTAPIMQMFPELEGFTGKIYIYMYSIYIIIII